MEKDDNKSVGTPKTAAAKKKDPEGNNKNTIVINPKLEEAKGGTVVLGWGRMNPITTGHEKLIKVLNDVARKQNATPMVYLTHTQNAKKDPLSYNDKIMLAQRAFGKIVQKSNSKTIIQVMQELQGKYKDVVLVVGADRIKEFDTLLNKYNGKDYTFDSIKVVSAGNRADPDSEEAKEMTADAMSASIMRKLASQGHFDDYVDDKGKKQKGFKSGIPKKLQSNARDVYDMVRSGMKIAEQMELDEAVLSIQQRRQRAIQMRRYKTKIQAARKRLAKRPATKEKIKLRARKKAIQMIRNMVAGKKGQNYADLSPSEKAMIDQRVQKRKKAIDRIAIKLLPKIKKADMQRIASRSRNEEFEMFIETIEPSSKKRYHQARNQDGTMKYDKRFKSFKNVLDENAAQERTKDKHDTEKEAMKDRHTAELNRAKRRDLNREITNSRNEEFDFIESIDEALDLISSNISVLQSLENKAVTNNIDLSELVNVYKNALTEDYDYDLTPQQYAFASVNTYVANIKEGVNDPGIFKAVFLAGGPGSGKSFIVGKTALTSMGLKLINSDDAFEHQLKKVGLTTTPEDIYSDLGQSVRGKAKALTTKRQSIALQGRLGLIVDGTGKDFDKIKRQADELKKIGYEVAMIFVNTDVDTAQARNKARTRTLPEKEVRDMWDAVQRNMGKFQNYFGQQFIIVDNSDGANYEGAVNTAYKKMGAWIKKDPIKPAAKKWIKSQKAERGMKEEVSLDEAFETALQEKTLTPAEKKKREEIAKAIERDEPDMPMDKKMAIATATAKRVAEATVDTADVKKKENISSGDKTKLAAISRMMNREKAKRQHDLAQKARDKGDTDVAQKHDTKARELTHEEVVVEEVVELEELTAAEKKMINQMYDKKGNLTPLGKKVMDHGKAASKLSPKDSDKDAARRKEYKAYQKKMRKEEFAEAVATGKQKTALKALMRQALGGKAPKAGYTSSIATNGDFVVYDGGMRIQGRIKKGDFKDPLKG